jgi:hypothetical protein
VVNLLAEWHTIETWASGCAVIVLKVRMKCSSVPSSVSAARTRRRDCRFEAARVLGWTAIAAVVRDETDDQASSLTLVENLQRADLSPKRGSRRARGAGARTGLDHSQ